MSANPGTGSSTRLDYSGDGKGAAYPQGVNTGVTGGGQAHNNTSAYQTIYAWRRTA